ncbi:endonuclease/exonuclease/phosphatase family protein [Austwickia chelonae]|uniref:endonuclease/exonuclease/phosphatase family protein n=1 Tax=Austwickia chelonae TaxID=100225 RepID=UPI0013C2F57B|nr:endonuclease/exonuclease/phosphatase family protein [Austwickia chelonae]
MNDSSEGMRPSRKRSGRTVASSSQGGVATPLVVLAKVFAIVCCAGLVLLGMWDTAEPLIPILQSVLGFGSAALALLVVAWRRGSMSRVGWACLAVLVALAVAPSPFPVVRVQGDPASPDLTVLTLNCQLGQADPKEIIDRLSEFDPDVVVLVETNPRHVEELDGLGLADRYEFRTGEVRDEAAAGSMVLTKAPQEAVVDPLAEEFTFQNPLVRVGVRGTPVLIRGVHVFPPVDLYNGAWHRELTALREWSVSAGESVVLAGDFNATARHPVFRALRAEVGSSSASSGVWPAYTWPQGSFVPPFVELDHVLSRGLTCSGHRNFVVSGTDHAGVYTRCVLVSK